LYIYEGNPLAKLTMVSLTQTSPKWNNEKSISQLACLLRGALYWCGIYLHIETSLKWNNEKSISHLACLLRGALYRCGIYLHITRQLGQESSTMIQDQLLNICEASLIL